MFFKVLGEKDDIILYRCDVNHLFNGDGGWRHKETLPPFIFLPIAHAWYMMEEINEEVAKKTSTKPKPPMSNRIV